MNLFPIKVFSVELKEDAQSALAELRRNTEITNNLVSTWTDKAFRGQVGDKKFKVISSEVGRGAICVFNGVFEGNKGIIDVQVHNAFKVIFSILMFLPAIGFIIGVLSTGIKNSLGLLIPVIMEFVFVRFIFIGLSFRFISNTGLSKLKGIIGITDMKTRYYES